MFGSNLEKAQKINLHHVGYVVFDIFLLAPTDDLLCTIDQKYSRQKGQSVRDHLRTLQSPPNSVIRGGEDTIEQVADMYEHARFGNKVSLCKGQNMYEDA